MAGEASNPEVRSPSSDPNPNSVEATIASGSTCNNINISNAESSVVTLDDKRACAEATDYYKRALEIWVAHFGELAPECVYAYFRYGCALLYKVQKASMPDEEDVVPEGDSREDGPVNLTVNCESSNAEESGSTHCLEATPNNNAEGKAEGDEDESELDLAWKMLDVARAIVEKHPGDTLEKVDIFSTLAEVALEREDVETSLSDYLKALAILKRLVEPDSKLIAELNFKICLCLLIGCKPEEAIPYCQKAVSVFKSRVQRLTDELKKSGPEETLPGDSIEKKEAEVERLTGLYRVLEEMLEDLQQHISNPKSNKLGYFSAKAKAVRHFTPFLAVSSLQNDTMGTGGSISTQTVAAAETSVESGPSKKPTGDPSVNNGAGSAT